MLPSACLPWGPCCPQQGHSGLLGWEQVSPWVPCHQGAVLWARGSPEGAAGAGDTGCAWCPPHGAFPGGCMGAAEVGGSPGLTGVVSPITVSPVMVSMVQGLAWPIISCCSHSPTVSGLVTHQWAQISAQSLEL